MQLLLIFHLLPQIGLNVSSEVAAIIGMSLCTAAYQTEILRGGLQSVPRGLIEAADMCGMGAVATFRRIRLPIAVRLTLPALTSEAIMILKASSLVSVVGVIELTQMAKDLASSTYEFLPIYASAGLIYLIINAVLAAVGRRAGTVGAARPCVTGDLALITENAGAIAAGIGMTILLWVAGAVLGSALGFLVAIGRRYGPRPLQWLLLGYVELIRGTPFLIQIYLLYYGGPSIGIWLDNFPAGLIGLTIYGGAYYAELFRTGFEAIPRGHLEAAETVGLTRAQTMRRIILPEMTMLVLPSMVNMTILLLKETAVLSVISVKELTNVAAVIGSANYAYVICFAVLALVYWALVESCGAAGRAAESRLSRYRFATA